jgi:L-seryl-tRNA(Ser) seleniumtransferase
VLSFSGDKVLGGPQAGIVLGRAELVERMARNPLHRALRIDKLAIASLSATLGLLSQGRYRDIPVLRMIMEDPSEVRARAERLRDLLGLENAEVVATRAVVGGGSAPTKSFPSYGLLLRRPDATALLARLRAVRPAVVARIEDDRITFDLKAVDAGLVEVLAEKIREALGSGL